MSNPQVYVVRAGRHGEREAAALTAGIATVGWDEVGDLRNFSSREALKDRLVELYPDKSSAGIGNWAGQLWRFSRHIQEGATVVLPSKQQATVHVGRVTGPYYYAEEGAMHHCLPVAWRAEVSRTAFDQDLLYSLGSLLTVSSVNRETAAERIWAAAEGTSQTSPSPTPETGDDSTVDSPVDLVRRAGDDIVRHMLRTLDGHDFADLITQLLEVQGYVSQSTNPGADGGVDILAGSGPLGFGEPRVCVQVKFTTGPVDVKVLRELQGVMRRTKAEHGLLVSWGGFRQSVRKEARDDHFYIRLWSEREVLEQIYRHYDRLSEEWRARVPLRRIWALVPDTDE
ncbi:restriction endonuclease [Lewinella sp. JB7]|uniref:restriction endonuclease n=1 Tax=Lewinella sp. JB7 TaxID=2962887 RepID=UPI0020C9EE68|nr:restriction endonuclease [Lewinella sp. JB7]MCP9236543.1 restriction endonuclease [Lewinella sp. JB7]